MRSSSDYAQLPTTHRFKADAVGHVEFEFRLGIRRRIFVCLVVAHSLLENLGLGSHERWGRVMRGCNTCCAQIILVVLFRLIIFDGITWMSKMLMTRAGSAMAAACLLRPISGPGYYPVPYCACVRVVATSRILPWLCVNLSTKAANIGIKNAQNANRRLSVPLPRFRCIITYSTSILHIHICYNIVT